MNAFICLFQIIQLQLFLIINYLYYKIVVKEYCEYILDNKIHCLNELDLTFKLKNFFLILKKFVLSCLKSFANF